jgi:hypothetical protein
VRPEADVPGLIQAVTADDIEHDEAITDRILDDLVDGLLVRLYAIASSVSLRSAALSATTCVSSPGTS